MSDTEDGGEVVSLDAAREERPPAQRRAKKPMAFVLATRRSKDGAADPLPQAEGTSPTLQGTLPLPAARRVGEIMQDVMTRAEAAGLESGDPMHVLVRSMSELAMHVSTETAAHAQQVQAVTVACRTLIDSSRERAQADVAKMQLALTEQISTAVEADLSRMIQRLPRRIGALQAAVIGVAGVLLLAGGAAGGAWAARSQLEAQAVAMRAAFAPGTPDAALWLRVHDLNPHFAAEWAQAPCALQRGQKVCAPSMYAFEQLPPAP